MIGINAANPDESTLWQFGQAGMAPMQLTSFSNLADGQQSFPGVFPDDVYPAQTGAMAIDTLGYPGRPRMPVITSKSPCLTLDASVDFEFSA